MSVSEDDVTWLESCSESDPLSPTKASPRKRFSIRDVAFEEDKDMLWGRKIARFFHRWLPGYAKNASIDAAWAYFENVSLPRRKVDGRGGFVLAKRGESSRFVKQTSGIETRLYPPWTTPLSEFRDFGIGVAVYFETLRALIVICFVAGLIYVPTILYYDSSAYDTLGRQSLVWPLRGSLVCTDTKWVPCPTCTPHQWADSPQRIATAADSNLTFVLSNECADIRMREGLEHLLVILFLFVAIFALGFHQKKLELKYDEAILSASDYSIKVDDPPPDATDPEEWKEFFSQFEDAHVTYVTVGLHNEDLINALLKRRLLLQGLRHLYPSALVTEQEHIPLQELISYASTHKPRLANKFIRTEETCRNLLSPEQEYVTTSIFVTFETERAQRNVLQSLSVGQKDIIRNNVAALENDNYAFRGKYVLRVAEASEPSTIRWQDQDETVPIKIGQRILTSLLTIFIIWGGFVWVRAAFLHNNNLAAFLIAILNILGPQLFKLVNKLEAHPDEGSWQASLYMKICIFRWINTAIVTTMVTPFMDTIAVNGLIEKLHAILKAEIITQPVVHMLDIWNNIKRHIFAPNAANQESMNSNFRGSIQHFGEKYTAMTKIIFLCMFYSLIFPASFFYGAIAYAALFYTDKFLIFRGWAAIPEIGNDVAKLSRHVYFPMTLVIMIIMSEFYMSAYPFDCLCDTKDFVNSGDSGEQSFAEYIGTHTLTTLASDGNYDESVTVVVEGDGSERLYRFCSEDFSEHFGTLLRFFDRDRDDWMSKDQEFLTYLYGITVVVALVLSLGFYFQNELWEDCKSFFKGTYHTDEVDSGGRFSDQEEIRAYVPQYKHRNFAHPLIACDVDNIDKDHIGWTDSARGYDFYNITKEIDHLMDGRDKNKPAFAVVKHWDPSYLPPGDKRLNTEKFFDYGSLKSMEVDPSK